MKVSLKVKYLVLCAALSVGANSQTGPLQVGASRIEFTKLAQPPETPPTGRYEHEKLFLRAIVLDNGHSRAALVSVDGNAPDSIPPRVAEELKCPIENVIVSSTHSHSAYLTGIGLRPGGAPPPPPQPGPSPLDDIAVQAVREARAKLQPARMAFGTGRSYLNVNRDTISPQTRLWTQDANPDGPSDKTVAVLKFENLSGEPIAIYFNYAMHPVNLYLSGIISADYPGAACRYIEQIYGDRVVAVFTQGAEGDQNPLYLRASTAAMLQRRGERYQGQPLVREQVEAGIREARIKPVPLDVQAAEALKKFVEAEGIILAEEVLRVAHQMPAGVRQVRIWGSQKTVTCPGRVRTDQGREGRPGTYEDGPEVNLLVRVLGIGTTALVAVNAEVYNAIAQKLKARSPLADTVFVGLANGRANSGYVPTDDAFGRYTFQVLGSRLKPGCAETSLQDAALELLSTYLSGLADSK